MNKLSKNTFFRAMSVVTLFAVLTAQVALFSNVSNAAQITSRSLTLQAGAGGDGGSKPGGTVNHLFTYTIPSVSAIGSIQFQYCTTAADVGASTCTPPTGLDTSSATLNSASGVTGLTMVHSSANVFHLTRSPGGTFTPGGANTAVTDLIAGVVNPTTANSTFFVRISTYAAFDATGTPIDNGTVAASTADPILLSGVMPESLVFCTGATVGVNGFLLPDCSTATAGTITFNQLFSPTDTATSSSQMAASTNASSGYTISVNGPTLTSGANTIAGMGTAGVISRGTAQFGLNLKANTIATSTVPVGIEPAPVANATNYKGQPVTGYDTVDSFKFTTGDVVADSANGGAGGTDAQIFTVSYIANVPGSQPAGTYATTLTYICTPTY